ncbi:hypothetical protein [Mariprofundus micogutta]|nr:hypothetical protein [Mariprofundus micogutta]
MLCMAACSNDTKITEAEPGKPQHALYFVPLADFTSVGAKGSDIRLLKQQLPDPDHRYWQLEVFKVSDYEQITNITDHYIDTHQHPQLQARNSNEYIIHLPGPDTAEQTESPAAWLWVRAADATTVHSVASNRWQPVLLTPEIARLLQEDTRRRSKLAEKLADKAYFFGYATNEDALE